MSTASASLAKGLEDVQEFLDDRTPPVPAEQWLNRLQEALGQGPRVHDLWPAILLVGIRSSDDRLRDLCVRRYLELLDDPGSSYPALHLLSSILEEYDAYERPRAVLVQRIYRSLRHQKLDRRSEIIRFLLGTQRIFEISYDRGFVDGCVRCLLWLLDHRGNPSDRVLSEAIHHRIRDTLRFSGVPEVTELTIKRQLGKLPLADVPADFVASIYERLEGESNPRQILGSLKLMQRWYEYIPLRARSDPRAFEQELNAWRQERRLSDRPKEALEDTVMTRILEANSKVIEILSRVIDSDHWGDSAQVCAAAVDVLCRLPAARALIADPDRTRWPSLLAGFRRKDRRSLLPAALAFFECFVSGLRTDLKPDGDNVDPQDLKTYRQRLRFVYNWADLENDRWIVQTLSELSFDGSRLLADRRACLRALDQIDPGDLAQRLAEFAATEPSTDPLVPDILELIERRGEWQFWDVCKHYLSLVDPTASAIDFPHLPALFRAAGSTGHCGMVMTLVLWVFDSSNPELCSLAEEQLNKAGYGIFVERERTSRLIQSLQPQKDRAADALYQVFERIGEQELGKQNAQKQIGGHRFEFERGYAEVGLQLTNYQSFTTGKMIDLAIIDKKLEELTQKIDHLTQRKNELEVQRDRLLERKRALLNDLAQVEQQATETQQRERRARERLGQLMKKNQQLESEHSRRESEVDRAQGRLRDTAQRQGNTIRSLQSSYQGLQREERDNQRGIERCHGRQRGQEGALRAAQDALSRRQARARSLENERSRTRADSPRRGTLESSIRDARRHVSSQLSTVDNLKSDISSLGRQIDQHRRRIAEIRNSGRRIQQDIRAADEEVKREQSNVAAACRRRDACQREIESLHHQIHQEQATIAAIEERLRYLETQTRRLRDDISDLQEREAEIHRQLLPVIRSLEEAKREFQKINRQREAEEQDLRSNNHRFSAVTVELGKTLGHHQQQLDHLYEDVSRAHRALSELARQQTQGEQNLNELVSRIQDLMKQFETLREKAEKILLKQDDLAHSRSLLRRADHDRRELEELFDAYQLSKAAETYARISRRGQP